MSDPTALPNFPPPSDEHPLRGRMIDVLQDMGLDPNIDDDGDIAFHAGEPPQLMFVRCLDGELPVLRIFGQWQMAEQVPEDRATKLERCNDFTLQLNVIKVGLAGDNLLVTAEHVITPGADPGTLFAVSVNLILQVVGMWQQSWLEQPGAAPDGGSGGQPGAAPGAVQSDGQSGAQSDGQSDAGPRDV